MDWRSINFNWNRARAFLVTAEEGSFSAAAKALGSTQPTVGRQVAALEEELGVALFERIGNTLSLTPAGEELLTHGRAMAEAATQLSLRAAGQSLALEGVVSVGASELVAAFLLPPVLRRLRRAHPGIELDVVASNEASDLQRREADIAVRNFRPTQPELVAKELGSRAARLYAAPGYLERLGDPSSPASYAKAEFLGFDRTETMVRFLSSLGLPVSARNFPLVTENHLVQWEMCKQGLGISFLMEDVGDAEPRVVRVLPKLPPLPIPMWLVSHRELRTGRRYRVVFDLLAEALSTRSA